jgi:hypothetical protein
MRGLDSGTNMEKDLLPSRLADRAAIAAMEFSASAHGRRIAWRSILAVNRVETSRKHAAIFSHDPSTIGRTNRQCFP